MLHPNQTLDMLPIGMIFRVVKTPEQTAGKSLEMIWELQPHADGTPVHIHPMATETYKVLEGQIEVNINDRWHQLHQGEEISVLAGIPHTFRNPSEFTTKVYNIHAPAMEFAGYFEDLSKVVTKLSAETQGKLHMNLKTATYLAMLMKKYSKEIVSVNPPGFIISFLNLIGKARRLQV